MSLTWNVALITALSMTLAGAGLAQTEHFHPKGEPPSKHTIAVLEKARSGLPFSDTNIEGFLADDPDLTITINRSDLEAVMMGVKSLRAQIEDGTAKAEGDTEIIGQLAPTLVVFDPRFEIMPGTKGPSPEDDLNPYEVGPVKLRGE